MTIAEHIYFQTNVYQDALLYCESVLDIGLPQLLCQISVELYNYVLTSLQGVRHIPAPWRISRNRGHTHFLPTQSLYSN